MEGVKAILLMAGRGTRFGDPLPKQFHLLSGEPVYRRTLQKLEESALFEEIILVAPPELVEEVQQAVGSSAQVVSGGETRQASSFTGLLACGPETEIALIHDAVRPFVSHRILAENIEQARLHGAVDTCIPSTDTLVYTPDKTTIESIPDRSLYMRGQTPQTFRYSLIVEAHQKTSHSAATDDCQLVIELGHPIHIVNGDESNLKITCKTDLKASENFLLD